MLQTRQRADMVFSKFIGDEEIKTYINQSATELYDILVSRFEDYYTIQVPFTIVSPDYKTPIPEDFYKLAGVDLQIANGRWVTLDKWNFNERNAVNNATMIPFYGYFYNLVLYRLVHNDVEILPQSNAPNTYRMWYIPRTQTMTIGALASLTEQDLTFTAIDLYTDGNLITVEYTGGGTAGSEVVTVVGNAISVQIQSGVSTATQIKTALDASAPAIALITTTITGTAATAQVTFGPTNLSGGIIQVDMNGVNGWEEYIVIDAAIKCLIKEESDISALELQKAQMLKRIEAMASNRDSGRPDRIADVNTTNYPLGSYGRGF